MTERNYFEVNNRNNAEYKFYKKNEPFSGTFNIGILYYLGLYMNFIHHER